MLKYIFIFTLCGMSSVFADVKIQRNILGSGIQNASAGSDAATQVGDYGVYHVPQYMPGYPTAATIWPRVVEVKCQNDICEGYESSPALGRGEYLFFKPVSAVAALVMPPEAVAPTASPSYSKPPMREINKNIRQ